MTEKHEEEEFEPGEEFDNETAEQIVARLAKDPVYQARRAARDERRRAMRERCAQLARCLLDELASIGFPADSISDLIKRYAPVPNQAVAVLLNHLTSSTEPNHSEMIVRALTAAKEPFNGRYLTDAYDKTYDEGLRWAILNCIACTHPFNIEHWLKTAQPNAYIRKELKKLGYPIKP